MNHDYDDSSAGETPKTPAGNDDSPERNNMGLRSALSKFDTATAPSWPGLERERHSPSKEKERPRAERRDSIWIKIKNKMYSPGRGEISRPEHTGAIEKRVKKRREREIQRHVSRRRRHSVSDSGEESERPAKSRKTSSSSSSNTKHNQHIDHRDESKPHWISSTFTFIAQHPTVPHILSFYAQLLFNIFFLAGCAYMIWCFWSAVQGDVDKKSHEAVADIMAEMAECARHYTTNNCAPAQRAPALGAVCENWAKCMNRDPLKVGRAKVSAHTFAEIFNSFVEPISLKAMAFSFLLVVGSFASTNMAFGFFRNKIEHQYPVAPPNYGAYPPPPPTPQRVFSGADGPQYSTAGTPWHQQPQLEPGPSGLPQIEGGAGGGGGGGGSPVRKLMYH
jgi:hypothetical protein